MLGAATTELVFTKNHSAGLQLHGFGVFLTHVQGPFCLTILWNETAGCVLCAMLVHYTSVSFHDS